eukprot:gene62217-85088_t
MSVYYGATAAVKSDGDISEFFDLGVGVLQGDTLAPYLFVIVLDWVMRNAIPDPSLGFCIRARVGRDRCTTPALYVTDLDFADDIAVLSSTATNMQVMVLSIEYWALKVGLKINGPKTEFMLSGPLLLQSLCIWLLTRRAAALSAIRRLNRIWTSTALSTYIKLRLFNSLVVSILLYTAVTWNMNKTLAKALTSGYNRLLRY